MFHVTKMIVAIFRPLISAILNFFVRFLKKKIKNIFNSISSRTQKKYENRSNTIVKIKRIICDQKKTIFNSHKRTGTSRRCAHLLSAWLVVKGDLYLKVENIAQECHLMFTTTFQWMLDFDVLTFHQGMVFNVHSINFKYDTVVIHLGGHHQLLNQTRVSWGGGQGGGWSAENPTTS